jgi:hypothetical protein
MSGVLAAFDTEHALRAALVPLRAAGFDEIETYTPRALEEGPSILPSLVLLGGVLGGIASFALQSYADVFAYPLDIGGRPELSWPAFIPIAFENGILVAIATGFFGYFIVNRMPRLYEPIDESPLMRRATRDLWCVAIRTSDPKARDMLRSLSPLRIEDLPE